MTRTEEQPPAKLDGFDSRDLRTSFGLDEPDERWVDRLRDAFEIDALGRLGPYELIEALGHGGQGTVYRARQPGTRREVALKRLAAGAFASASMRARFEREIEAASLLNHPNIVRVYGSEMIDGQPVLSMEWIEGVPIDKWARDCAPAAQEGAAPRVASMRGLLETFVLACDAVSFAHQHGVLHRDLKPSNILVDRAGQPHVLDFGLAKLTQGRLAPDGGVDPRTVTHASGFLGTPAYASPEQVAGDPRAADARSDVYALGVILYQMLTGALPFNAMRNIVELFEAIRTREPARPSAIRRDLNRELDAIILRAMAKEPQRRYQSVDALGADVRRYLNNETVLAHPPSAAYQARKFVARHRGPVLAAGVAVAALIIGFGAVSFALVQTSAAQDQTRQAQKTAEQINDFLNQMLATADPGVTRGRDVTVHTMLDEAVSKLDAGALSGQSLAEAQVRMTIADAYWSLGLYPPAQAQYESALTLRRAHHGGMHADVADSLLKLALVLAHQEQFDDAHGHIDEALRIRTALAGPDSLPVIQAHGVRIETWIKMGRSELARSLVCELLPRAIRITGSDEHEEVLLLRGWLGYCGGCSGADSEGVKILEELLADQRRLFGHDDERASRTLINLGAQLQGQRDFERAESVLKEAVAIRRRVYGDQHPATATALFNLGGPYHHRHQWQEVESLMREALAIQEARLVPGHYHIGRSRHYLAHALWRQNRCAEAEPEYRRVIDELSDQPSAGQSRRAVAAKTELAHCLITQQRFEEAEALLLAAIGTGPEAGGDALRISRAAQGLVKLYQAWGKAEQAEHWKQRIAAEQNTATQPH